MKLKLMVLSAMLFAGNAMADADSAKVQMHMVDEKGVGSGIGQIAVTYSKYGVVFTPALKGLPPGLHGFHLHQNPSCDPKEKDGKRVAALGAGGHYDPNEAKRHDAPWGDGHLGDLPALFVDAEGNANHPVLAPRLKTADLTNRSLMVHVGGDNYTTTWAATHHADHAAGTVRMACGVIK